jgi:hypothetical protein
MEGFIRKNQLLKAAISAITVSLAVFLLVKLQTPHPPSNELDEPQAPNGLIEPFNKPQPQTDPLPLSPTIDTNVIETPTPLHYPPIVSGALGTNLPKEFKVFKWLSDYIQCDRDTKNRIVKVSGAIISGGVSPYEFDFWRFETFTPVSFIPTPDSIPTSGPDETLGETVLFEKAVELFKGKYYHVTISFTWEKGDAVWIEDLYYPNTKDDKRCR